MFGSPATPSRRSRSTVRKLTDRGTSPGSWTGPARPSALPGRARAESRGRGRRAVGRGGAAAADPPDPLEGDQTRQGAAASYSEGAKLGIPIGLAIKTGGPIVAAPAPHEQAPTTRRPPRLAALPGCSSGSTTGSPRACSAATQPNAADFQIAASLRPRDDPRRSSARDRLPSRGRAGDAVVPDFPGKTPPILPPAWLAPLRGPPRPRRAGAPALGPLLVPAEHGEGVGEAGAVGQAQFGVELQQRGEDEAAAASPRGAAG